MNARTHVRPHVAPGFSPASSASRVTPGFSPARRSPQSGYALLMVIFFGALVAIAATAAMPSVLTEGRRQMEEEMIWRGKQYARAVKLYYRKNGRFPQSMEDLTDARTGQVRFLRQAYKDPMNREDGSWRLIYVGPGGQLIGSVTRTSAIQLQPQPAQAGKAPAGKAPQPQQPGISGQVFGGNIIGVASKVPRRGIKVFEGREFYNEWEFIWDPARDPIQVGPAGGAPLQPGQQPGARPGGVQRPPGPPGKRQ